MATMYFILFSILFTAVCSIEGSRNSVLRKKNILLAQAASGSYFFSAKKYAKNSSLKTFDTKDVHPSTIVKNFEGDKTVFATTGKVTGGLRDKIINIATAELGVKESTGNNDGTRVEEYLRYTNLGKGYEWCAAFVSWCYGEAGLSEPRNPWSSALFPKAKIADKNKAQPADIFGIYGARAKRIHHVGLVKKLERNYIISIEGNSNDRVESRRRHLQTIHSIANWMD